MKTTPAVVMLVLAMPAAALGEPAIEAEIVVEAPVEKAWWAWTTEEGIRSFFAPAARIDARPDGAFEIWFDPSKPEGERGADGMRYLLVDPMTTLAFTWNAPPRFPRARGQRTHVVLRFEALSQQSTRVSLRHDGFGTGGEWDEVIAYFDRAWKETVLPRFAAAVRAEGE